VKQKNSILVVASEAAPFAKTGGLADAVSALVINLKRQGYQPSLIIPRYRCIGFEFSQNCISRKIQVPISDHTESIDLYETTLDKDIPVYLIDKPNYYDRDELYRTSSGDYKDNAERFVFFSRAVIESLPHLPRSVDVLHCNDWQTGLIPLYVNHFKQQRPDLQVLKTVFTIHNIAFQGLFWRFDMHLTGLPWSYFTTEGIEYYGDLNLMKGGIIYADAVNTVSEQYCREIQTPDFGCGLDGLLLKHKHKLSGILNGVDYQNWNPETDTHLPANYSAADLSGKQVCREHLLRKAHFNSESEETIIGMVTRLSSQKGLDLVSQAMPDLMSMPVKLILLGTGEVHYEEAFAELMQQYPGQFVFFNRFDESLAHLIEAGSDIFLMPSRYEPCGLNQMYSLRYGTIPVVRATGGLNDTVIDVTRYPKNGTGFKFANYNAEEMIQAIRKALVAYRSTSHWENIVRNGMECDFSWNNSAVKYGKLYRALLDNTPTDES
jgi:starch synthase